jgi:hypothetical protein
VLTVYGAIAVFLMMVFYALEPRAVRFTFWFAMACAMSSLYGWLAGTWPFGVVEAVWAVLALRKWWLLRQDQARLNSPH